MIFEQLNGQLGLDGIDPLQTTDFTVVKRDGRPVPFDETRVLLAIESAFKGERGLDCDESLDDTAQGCVQRLTESVVQNCLGRALSGELLNIERVQDIIEAQLMIAGHHSVARRYIVYREDRKKVRALRGIRDFRGRPQAELFVTLPDGTRERLDPARISRQISAACHGFETDCSTQTLTQETLNNLYNGIPTGEIDAAMLLAARSKMEQEPAYARVAARLLLKRVYRDAFLKNGSADTDEEFQRAEFPNYIRHGVHQNRLAPELLNFDLEWLARALRPVRDSEFTCEGLQTLSDRCLIKADERLLETPQFCWMRVAMGLAINEGWAKNDRAIEFYDVLSTLRFLPSISTIRNAGTVRPQLSASYVLTVQDDSDHVFKVISDDARLVKWDANLANDWTNIRATGSPACSAKGRSQGMIPFVKLAHDAVAAVDSSERTDSPICAYLETWHLDIGDFLEIGKAARSDAARSVEGIQTAHWIPDLFMKRVIRNELWTLFSPDDVPDLHDLYGTRFDSRYVRYEGMADRGEIKHFMRIEARQLWRKMLATLFNTGKPSITFKDPSNLRSPQDHAGVIHASSLCADTFLNTSSEEAGVCIPGSVNLARHLSPIARARKGENPRDLSGGNRSDAGESPGCRGVENIENALDDDLLQRTVSTALRMLDNAIGVGFYPTPEAKSSATRHRPIGLGLMGFQEALYELGIPYASDRAVHFADTSMETISFHTIRASAELAGERGTYESYAGSKWDRGCLPIDTIELLEKERGGFLKMDRTQSRNWSSVREAVTRSGMRNSNCHAITYCPDTAALAGVTPSVEPTLNHRPIPSKFPGRFNTLNPCLVAALKRHGLWDAGMHEDINLFAGSIQEIERIPTALKNLYKSAFEIDPRWLIECASRRQKWIDMGQSLTLYMAEPNGKRLHEFCTHAWESGLKGTCFLKSPPVREFKNSRSATGRADHHPRINNDQNSHRKTSSETAGSSVPENSRLLTASR